MATISHWSYVCWRSLWQAETRFDRDYMNELLAPEFFEFGRSGRIWTRSETLDAEPQVIRARLPLSKFAVHMVVPDVVLVTYRSEGLGDDVEVGNRASLWRKGANRWQLVFHQGTPTSR